MNFSNWRSKIGNFENGLAHHAFLLEGEIGPNISALKEFLEGEMRITVSGNPDYFEFVHGTFGIDEGRNLKGMQSRHSFAENGKKIFIIGADTFTVEAQNSLLKVFEEPTEGTHFFVLTPSAQFFLPTLLSRVVCIFSEEKNGVLEIQEFLKKSYSERLAAVLVLKEDPSLAKRFLEDMTRYFYEKTPAEKRTPETIQILELLQLYRTYAYGRAPAMKNMLEHVALVAPQQL
ncbi:MAG: hypothetical protein WCT49_03765 [Candidatus Paceibacterota bacterium]|jgi:hypothetical protein|nr:hypothetical protein [Candidatus Paceibacterota bacterium]